MANTIRITIKRGTLYEAKDTREVTTADTVLCDLDEAQQRAVMLEAERLQERVLAKVSEYADSLRGAVTADPDGLD